MYLHIYIYIWFTNLSFFGQIELYNLSAATSQYNFDSFTNELKEKTDQNCLRYATESIVRSKTQFGPRGLYNFDMCMSRRKTPKDSGFASIPLQVHTTYIIHMIETPFL